MKKQIKLQMLHAQSREGRTLRMKDFATMYFGKPAKAKEIQSFRNLVTTNKRFTVKQLLRLCDVFHTDPNTLLEWTNHVNANLKNEK